MRAWLAGLVSLALGTPGMMASPQGLTKGRDEVRTLYFFFTPEARGAAESARKLVEFLRGKRESIRLRPVILVTKFEGIGKLDEKSPLYVTLKELQSLGALDIPLYDEEGLRLAEAWEIRSVPALVLVSRGRAHRALGPRANLEELLGCKP